MPIRINLLAEAQALEELRRRDPVKRTIWLGAVLGAGVLVFSGYLQTKIIVARSELSAVEAKISQHKSEYARVTDSKTKLDNSTSKLNKLQQLATNRFLNGTVLDALQHTTVDDVQLTHLKIVQEYLVQEGTKQKTDAEGHVTAAAKPGRSTEKIMLQLDGKDFSGIDQWSKYKSAIAGCSYFEAALGKTNEVKLTDLKNQQASEGGRAHVSFTLTCTYPERNR